jgi:hypothetical protein
MAELELPEKKPSEAAVSDTALRIGMICGLAMGMNKAALQQLIDNKSEDFRYAKETAAVLKLYEEIFSR